MPIRSIDNVHTGDVITINLPDMESDIIPTEMPLDIIYEDEDMLVLNKSGYMAVHPSHGHREDTLANGVVFYLGSKGMNKAFRAVGRLDKDTEGLMLLTNNGKYAHFLTSPNHHVIKKYYVEVEKEILEDEIRLFCNGLEIRDGKDELYITKDANLELITEKTCYVYISEGKFHQIKRMFEKINNKVLYLKRVKFGDIELDESLELGQYRELTEEEIKLFKREK